MHLTTKQNQNIVVVPITVDQLTIKPAGATVAQTTKNLELVLKLRERGHLFLQILPLADIQHQLSSLGASLQRIRAHHVPMVKDTLGERLTRGCSPQLAGEPKGLNDREVSLDVVEP